jgi:hypothetical protein
MAGSLLTGKQALLAVGLALLLVLPVGIWWATQRGPSSVLLAELSAKQESYSGREVRTHGVVREFTDRAGTYYVIEDARPKRVEIRPASVGAPYVGQDIVVVGRFHWDERQGRSLAVERLEPPAA